MIMAMPWPPPTHIVFESNRLIAFSQTVDQRTHDAGAGHAVGVADCDRPSMWVQLLTDVDAGLVRTQPEPERQKPR